MMRLRAIAPADHNPTTTMKNAMSRTHHKGSASLRQAPLDRSCIFDNDPEWCDVVPQPASEETYRYRKPLLQGLLSTHLRQLRHAGQGCRPRMVPRPA